MRLVVVKTSPNGRMFSRKSTFDIVPKKNLPSLSKNRDSKQVKTKPAKINTFLTNQACFINKKDVLQCKANRNTVSFQSSSIIFQNANKKRELNKRKNSQPSTSIEQFRNLQVTCKNWCLYDQKIGKYFGFRQHSKREIASLTKIMTVLLSIQFISSFKISLSTFIPIKECKVRITKNSVNTEGTTANLQKNYWISLEDLLYGAMLPSGNDAAYLLSEYVGYFMYLFNHQGKTLLSYSELHKVDLTDQKTINYVKQFVSCMNERINYMGLISTQFSNPHGLQNALNVSSALDSIKLCIDASKNKLFKRIMSTMFWQCQLYQNQHFKTRIQRKWTNTNQLLQKDWQGIKTGFTTAAGGCLASLKEGIYIVVLNSSNSATRFSDTEKIYKWYLDQKKIKQSRDLRLKLAQSLYLSQKTRDFKCFSTLDNVETDITQ